MTIDINKFNNYGLYNLTIGNKVANENAKKAEQTEEVKPQAEFLGLQNETDLLTKNVQNLYRTEIKPQTAEDREIAENTNKILASLGYDYKVTASQVASVAGNMNTVIQPEMDNAEANAVEARIANPEGPFAELFA